MTYQKHFKVVSFGDLVVDIVVGVSHFPIEPSAHQMARFVTLEPGGSGNFLIAGAHLGLNMSALGTVGSDDFSTRMLDILNEKNINTTTIVRQVDGTTTTVLVLADTSGRHVFLGNRGTGPELPLSETWRASLSAAGDSFDAAFIYAYIQQWPLRQIAAFANAMGAAKVRKIGTGRQVPTSGEVRQVLEEFSVSVPFLYFLLHIAFPNVQYTLRCTQHGGFQ